MTDQTTFYPLKVVSRSLPSTRTNRIRVSWFIVGMAFGVGCALAVRPVSIPSPEVQISLPLAPVSPATQEVVLNGATEPEVPELVETFAALEPAAGPAVPPITRIYPADLSLKVGNGDTLTGLLTSAGVASDEAYSVVEAIGKTFNPKKLDIGQNVTVHLDKDPVTPEKPIIKALILPISLTSTLEVTRSGEVFDVKKIDAPVERKLSRAGGNITSSLYDTGLDSGLPASLLSELITAYSYDVDFQRDIKSGDDIDVLYEKMQTKDGVTASYGNIIFAELGLGDRTLRIYRYVDGSGNADYYNEKGESVRKALLRTPINGARITSRFGMRNHPLLGYTKMHRGVDFGAPTGTPIYAAGDGTVEFVGKKGGYGNYLKIKHNNTYASAYGHISRFASGIGAGRKVKQGQIVAYVGSTGQSTGPHLHYEILANNVQVNPSGVKFKTGSVLKGKELAAFRKNVESIQAMRNATPKSTTLAMNLPQKNPAKN